MANILSLPNSVLVYDIFSFFKINDLLTLRLVSKSLKTKIDNLLSLRVEYLSQKLAESEKSQISQDLLELIAPTMQASIASLNTIDQASLFELKAYANPPRSVVEVMELVNIILTAKAKAVSWNEIKANILKPSILSDLKSYELKPMKNSLYIAAEKYLSRLDSNSVRNISLAAGIIMMWCENVMAVNKIYHQDENGKAYIKNEEMKERLRKEIRILNNLLNVSTRMKKISKIGTSKVLTRSPTKKISKSPSKPVVKASLSTEESKLVKEMKRPSPAKPLSKSPSKQLYSSPSKPSTPVIGSVRITPTKVFEPILKKKYENSSKK